MKLIYPAVFYKGFDGEGYSVEVPDLPGCSSGADTLEETIEMGIDAASGWILGELEDGNTIPPASSINDIKPDEDDDAEEKFVSLLTLDIDSYAEKYGKKSIRRNITIPAWLDTFGKEQHINFSQLLQKSLFEMTQS